MYHQLASSPWRGMGIGCCALPKTSTDEPDCGHTSLFVPAKPPRRIRHLLKNKPHNEHQYTPHSWYPANTPTPIMKPLPHPLPVLSQTRPVPTTTARNNSHTKTDSACDPS